MEFLEATVGLHALWVRGAALLVGCLIFYLGCGVQGGVIKLLVIDLRRQKKNTLGGVTAIIPKELFFL